jgi:hypothetical protein
MRNSINTNKILDYSVSSVVIFAITLKKLAVFA